MTYWQQSGGDVSDASLMEDEALIRTQLGEAPPAADPAKYGNQLHEVIGPDGNPVFVRTDDQGGVHQVDGYTPLGEEEWVNIATPPGQEGVWQKSSTTGQLRRVGGGGVNVTVDNGVKPSRVPSGWEGYYDESGNYNLRPSPGGPADIEAQAGANSKETMDAVITTFASQYQKLNEAGAVRNSEKGPLANMSAYFQTSDAGREFGKMTGSKAEAARETIEAMQPNIVQAIMSQPGISAKAFDSDKELEFFLKSITAPRADYMANMTALYILDKKFGTGTAIQKILTPDELASVQQLAAADPLNFQLDQVMDASAAQPSQSGSQGVPEGVDPADWEFLTEEERALFSGGSK
ncbi:MAG: hypothetical protein HRT82_17070 [Henriciella sp.]|nr:hypothetical protein [Henriciella sp.]